MNHRFEMRLAGLDYAYLSDMVNVNVTPIRDESMCRILQPAEAMFVLELVYDGHCLSWMHFCVSNAISFTYRFIGI